MADAESFDTEHARWYRPNPDLVKTAVFIDVADPAATTVINAPFGIQRLRGPFYAVVEGDATYGAAKREFEATHDSAGPSMWVKIEPVQACQSTESCTIRTLIDDHEESSVVAEPGDWIVRQLTGETYVLSPASFSARFEPEGVDARPGPSRAPSDGSKQARTSLSDT